MKKADASGLEHSLRVVDDRKKRKHKMGVGGKKQAN